MGRRRRDTHGLKIGDLQEVVSSFVDCLVSDKCRRHFYSTNEGHYNIPRAVADLQTLKVYLISRLHDGESKVREMGGVVTSEIGKRIEVETELSYAQREYDDRLNELLRLVGDLRRKVEQNEGNQ